jgi:hypothetical protein
MPLGVSLPFESKALLYCRVWPFAHILYYAEKAWQEDHSSFLSWTSCDGEKKFNSIDTWVMYLKKRFMKLLRSFKLFSLCCPSTFWWTNISHFALYVPVILLEALWISGWNSLLDFKQNNIKQYWYRKFSLPPQRPKFQPCPCWC